MRAAQALPHGRRHAIVLTGMVGFYLSDAEASAPEALPIARGVSAAVGGLVAPAMVVFKTRRLGGRLTGFRGSRSETWQAERDSRLALRVGR
jgi:hypothetical protein